jgi:hypothetical protein
MTRLASRSAVVLCVLTALFAGRVLGQALVAFFAVPWLPPMDAWFSGLVPYPMLLAIQVAILLVQAVIDRDVWRGHGFFARRRPRAGRRLQWLACAYALSMLGRYAITRTHRIPIVFHWVLAAYLFTLGRQAADNGSSASLAPRLRAQRTASSPRAQPSGAASEPSRSRPPA